MNYYGTLIIIIELYTFDAKTCKPLIISPTIDIICDDYKYVIAWYLSTLDVII